jgi:hypothetical protein
LEFKKAVAYGWAVNKWRGGDQKIRYGVSLQENGVDQQLGLHILARFTFNQRFF